MVEQREAPEGIRTGQQLIRCCSEARPQNAMWGTDRPVQEERRVCLVAQSFSSLLTPDSVALFFSVTGKETTGTCFLCLLLGFINADCNPYLLYRGSACLNTHRPVSVFRGCGSHHSPGSAHTKSTGGSLRDGSFLCLTHVAVVMYLFRI